MDKNKNFNKLKGRLYSEISMQEMAMDNGNVDQNEQRKKMLDSINEGLDSSVFDNFEIVENEEEIVFNKVIKKCKKRIVNKIPPSEEGERFYIWQGAATFREEVKIEDFNWESGSYFSSKDQKNILRRYYANEGIMYEIEMMDDIVIDSLNKEETKIEEIKAQEDNERVRDDLREKLKTELLYQFFLLDDEAQKSRLRKKRKEILEKFDNTEFEEFDVSANDEEYIFTRKIKKVKRYRLDSFPILSLNEKFYDWIGDAESAEEITQEDIEKMSYTTFFSRNESGKITHWYYKKKGMIYELEPFTDENLKSFIDEEESYRR